MAVKFWINNQKTGSGDKCCQFCRILTSRSDSCENIGNVNGITLTQKRLVLWHNCAQFIITVLNGIRIICKLWQFCFQKCRQMLDNLPWVDIKLPTRLQTVAKYSLLIQYTRAVLIKNILSTNFWKLQIEAKSEKCWWCSTNCVVPGSKSTDC